MPKQSLTDQLLKALGPAEPGKRYELRDSVVSGLLVRVTATGKRTFMFQTRFPGSRHPTRRAIGEYGVISLAEARAVAGNWIDLISKGIDPPIQKKKEPVGTRRQSENTFSAIVDAYMQRRVIGENPAKPCQRRGAEVKRAFERVFVPLWGSMPVADITRQDVIKLIEGVRDRGTAGALAAHGIKISDTKGPAPVQARNLLSYLKTFFSWIVETDAYGLQASPCDHIKPRRLFGKRFAGDRTLNDDELFAFWRATARIGYPFGPIYQLLLLNGLRLNEVADSSESEFDREKKIWTIPAERMKGKDNETCPHVVPITPDTAAILESLPRFKKGHFLFSTTSGATSVWVGDKVKKRLTKKMQSTLRALARVRGNASGEVKLRAWKNHDLRRTLRSRLSELQVDADVADAVLACVKPTTAGGYDRYELLDEKRHALELWASHLKTITSAKSKVVSVRIVPLDRPRDERPRASFAQRLALAKAEAPGN